MAERDRRSRNIERADGLVPASQELRRGGAAATMPAGPYYPEIRVWVNVRCAERESLTTTIRQLRLQATDRSHQPHNTEAFSVFAEGLVRAWEKCFCSE